MSQIYLGAVLVSILLPIVTPNLAQARSCEEIISIFDKAVNESAERYRRYGMQYQEKPHEHIGILGSLQEHLPQPSRQSLDERLSTFGTQPNANYGKEAVENFAHQGLAEQTNRYLRGE